MEEIKTTVTDTEKEMIEVKPIKLEDVYKTIKSDFAEYISVDWHGHELIVRNYISYDEMVSFVNAVVSACFNEETGEYEPQNRDFMYKYGEIIFYTNVELPKDTSEAYDVVYALDLNEVIEEHVNIRQIADIQQSISEQIEYRMEQNTDALKAELRKFEDVFRALGETMSVISPEEIEKTMAAISEHGKLDEGAIVRALFPKDGGDSDGKDQHAKRVIKNGKRDS